MERPGGVGVTVQAMCGCVGWFARYWCIDEVAASGGVDALGHSAGNAAGGMGALPEGAADGATKGGQGAGRACAGPLPAIGSPLAETWRDVVDCVRQGDGGGGSRRVLATERSGDAMGQAARDL